LKRDRLSIEDYCNRLNIGEIIKSKRTRIVFEGKPKKREKELFLDSGNIEAMLYKTRAIEEDKRRRFLLEYDKGISYQAEAACKTMEDRRKQCNKFGWAGQFAYFGHLLEHGIKNWTDDPFSSPSADECDFKIYFDSEEKRIETKTVSPPLTHKDCRIYKTKRIDDREIEVWHRPDFIIALKCLNPEMTVFKIYGYLSWQDVEKYGEWGEYEEGGRWGIPLESPVIKDYGDLLAKMVL
jgi:hypothetical protein